MRIYNGGLGQNRFPSWVQGQTLFLGSQGSWTPFCIITTWGVGQFVLKTVFAEQKNFVGRLGGHGPLVPWIRRWSDKWWLVTSKVVNVHACQFTSGLARDYVPFGSLLSQIRLSVVCNVGAPYSEDWTFRQYFFATVYAGHPLTSVQNFTEIVPGEPLRRER